MDEKSTKGTEIDLIKHLNNCIEQDLIDAIIMKGQRMASKYSKGEPLEKKMKMTEDLPEKANCPNPMKHTRFLKLKKLLDILFLRRLKAKWKSRNLMVLRL